MGLCACVLYMLLNRTHQATLICFLGYLYVSRSRVFVRFSAVVVPRILPVASDVSRQGTRAGPTFFKSRTIADCVPSPALRTANVHYSR